jgi:hypothetical protein
MRAPRALEAAERATGGPGTLPEAVCEALTAHHDEAFVAWHEASPAECAYLRSIATRPDGATS